MSYLGMYVHAHWAYKHPYASRTWTLEDWRGYAQALTELGYNLIMIWPMLETIPDPPTPSDVAQLEKFARITTMLQDEFGMTVLFTLGPNTVGNSRAADYSWQERPFFKTDQRLDPGNPEEMDKLIRIRRELLRSLSHADGFSIIDSDPGGYIGSTNEQFADLMERHLEMLREINPQAILYYWMWAGWESYSRFWALAEETGEPSITSDERDWDVVLRRMMTWPDDSWRLLSCNAAHQCVVERLGLAEKAIHFPYGLVEGEPRYPHTNCDPEAIANGLTPYREKKTYLGSVANCQTHAVQQPNTYLFSHFAQGRPPEQVDLVGFAEELVPGLGKIIAQAWTCLDSQPADARRAAGAIDDAAAGDPAAGRYSGLLFAPPQRFLEDLAMQLRLTADAYDFENGDDSGQSWKPRLRALADSFAAWTNQTGFVDAYYGQFRQGLHQKLLGLGNPELNSVIEDFQNWRTPAARHGIMPRLIGAMRRCAEEAGE